MPWSKFDTWIFSEEGEEGFHSLSVAEREELNEVLDESEKESSPFDGWTDDDFLSTRFSEEGSAA
mgnify:CR=1 FL=1